MSKPRFAALGTLLAVGTIVAGRWLALIATAYFSLFHWMRSEYLEYSHVWQYGLPLLDPRVTSALLWWLLYSLFLVVVLLPLAHWLAERMPTAGRVRWAVWVALALGLGTRGIAGPIVMRAATAQPVTLLPGGGELSGGVLVDTAMARGVVALTEAWWLLPALVVGIRAAAGTPLLRCLHGWRAALLLILYAFVESPEAAYLLTAGGPRGGTMSLPLLAFQLGFGGQEFGYASVLTVLMSGIVLLGSLLPIVRPGDATVAAPTVMYPTRGFILWWAVPLIALLPLIVACYRNPPEAVEEPRLVLWTLFSLVTAAAAAGWVCILVPALSRMRESPRRISLVRAFLLAPMLLPSLVWILPAVRVIGEQRGWADAVIPCVGMVLGAPYLYLGWAVFGLARTAGDHSLRPLLTVGLVVAWATWTDLLNPLMLTQTVGGAQLLPTGVVWSLSTHLWSSPLSAPGWVQAWLGAGGFALPAVALLLSIHDERPNPSQ